MRVVSGHLTVDGRRVSSAWYGALRTACGLEAATHAANALACFGLNLAVGGALCAASEAAQVRYGGDPDWEPGCRRPAPI